MKILVYGAGAIGSYVGARIVSQCRVALLTRPKHAQAINRSGLKITGASIKRGERVERVEGLTAHTRLRDVDFSPDIVLVTVKSFDTESAAHALAEWSNKGIAVSLQNGLGNEESLANHLPRVMGGVINQGVVLTAPGEIHHAGGANTYLGPHRGVTMNEVEEVAKLLTRSELTAEATEQIELEIWGKAIINAAVNPLSALLRKRSGELLDGGPMERTMRLVIDESVVIAQAHGIELSVENLVAKCGDILAATRDNKSSMYQDLEKGRPTEIESMNGALERRAQSKRIPATVNRLLAELIRAAESS